MNNKNSDAIIRAVKLSKFYPATQTSALRDVDISISQGEFVMIMGPSGSGKSTLLNIAAGLITPTGGKLYFKEKPLSDIKNYALYRRVNIGYIFQDFYLYPGFSVIENVLMPQAHRLFVKTAWKKKAMDIMNYMGMSRKARHSVNVLSAGERQRTCIARALLNDPPLILADEPTGNLDTDNACVIMNILQKINKDNGATIIMVTHNTDIAKYSNRLIRMRDGRIDHLRSHFPQV